MAGESYLTVWETYQSAWSDIPDDRRDDLLRRSVAADCVYTDPSSVSAGLTELTARIEASQRKFPGAWFRNDRFAEHHRQAISEATMFDGQGTAIYTGTSYARFNDAARLVQMTGFFQPVA